MHVWCEVGLCCEKVELNPVGDEAVLIGKGVLCEMQQTMNQVFELAGDLVPAKVAHDLMRLLAKGAGEDDVEADSLLRCRRCHRGSEVLVSIRLSKLLHISTAPMAL
jgi:hypothetical protein